MLAERLRGDTSRLSDDIGRAGLPEGAAEPREMPLNTLVERHAKLAHSLAEVEAQLAAAAKALAAVEAALQRHERDLTDGGPGGRGGPRTRRRRPVARIVRTL